MKIKGKIYLFAVLALLALHLLISHGFSNLCTINKAAVLGTFSVLSNSTYIFLGLISVTLLLGLIPLFTKRARYQYEFMVLALSAFAGFSNLVDRVVHGGVCDYLTIPIINSVINLNDFVLTLNAIVLTILILLRLWRSR